MLDTQPKIILETPSPPPKPRIRYRDYRCVHCARLLMRANLDTIALALPKDFKDAHPLLCAALSAIHCEIRCPKCGVINTYQPMIDNTK